MLSDVQKVLRWPFFAGCFEMMPVLIPEVLTTPLNNRIAHIMKQALSNYFLLRTQLRIIFFDGGAMGSVHRYKYPHILEMELRKNHPACSCFV